MSGNNNITTYVQNGETLSLYASMYGCSVNDIKQANGLSGTKLKEGQQLVIPIGKPPQGAAEPESVLDKKLAWFDDKLDEVHLKLYNPNLKPTEREALEQEYIELKNLKKERDKVAEFTKAGNGQNLVLEMKKTITISEFRRLFPECTQNFMNYAYDTDQAYCDPVHGWVADPDDVCLNEGDKIMINSRHYAHTKDDGFWRGVYKFFGGRLD